jgi:hypothetical protein
MIGHRSSQCDLFEVGNVFPLDLDPQSFHGQLALASARLFSDDSFAALYADHRGRPSVPPSQLALLTLLQHHAGCSDEEAIDRTAYDLRWAAVLRREAGTPLCAKSTLQLFRSHLILHEGVWTLFQSSLQEARRAGLLKGAALKIAIDTKPILGRGAVLDTYNLLGRGIRQLVGAWARSEGQASEAWAHAHDLSRYFGSSLKGEADLDWSDPQAREAGLTEIVVDARRLLRETGAALESVDRTETREAIRSAAELLERVLLQDVIETVRPPVGKSVSEATVSEAMVSEAMVSEATVSEATVSEATVSEATVSEATVSEATVSEATASIEEGLHARIREGTAPDRMPSITDPEQRHGRKSRSHRFTGHKALIAVDLDSQIIIDGNVLAGNDGDAVEALEQTKRVEATTGQSVESTTGDCAFGGGETRQAFADAGRTLLAKVPQEAGSSESYPKSAFRIDLEGGTVTCPGGETTATFTSDGAGGRTFRFGSVCSGCPLRPHCTGAAAGRTVRVHPQEALLRGARVYQAASEGRETLRQRVGVEHALARLAKLGIGQARYFGRKKTRFQLLMAATIANLRWTWNWSARTADAPPEESAPAGPNAPLTGSEGPEPEATSRSKGARTGPSDLNHRRGPVSLAPARLLLRLRRLRGRWTPRLLSRPSFPFPLLNPTFRPHF